MMQTEDSRIAFFCRAKPQGVDALDVFMRNRGVYIGYPIVKSGMQYDPFNLEQCLVNFTCPEDEWSAALAGCLYARSANRNRNFVPKVTLGSYVVIPRPNEGRGYVGRVNSGFQIVNNPQNVDAYLKRCKQQHQDGSEEKNAHRADVAMGWSVDEYRAFDLSMLPCWLRSSLQGRSTYGEFKNHPVDPTRTAVSFFDDLLAGKAIETWDWTKEIEVIKRRLIDTLTTSSFEHLIVGLLQLEHPDERWVQTGGAGDGGIDGLGFDARGKTTAVMQAKLFAPWPPDFEGVGSQDQRIRRYGAVLVLENRAPDYPWNLLDIDWVASTLQKHASRVPLAISIRARSA